MYAAALVNTNPQKNALVDQELAHLQIFIVARKGSHNLQKDLQGPEKEREGEVPDC